MFLKVTCYKKTTVIPNKINEEPITFFKVMLSLKKKADPIKTKAKAKPVSTGYIILKGNFLYNSIPIKREIKYIMQVAQK